MLRDFKDTILDYTFIGGTMAILSALIKPFISIRETVRDSAITFIVSLLCGLLIEYWNIPVPVKYGLCGVAGLFGVRIYSICEKLLRKVEENPDKIIDKLK